MNRRRNWLPLALAVAGLGVFVATWAMRPENGAVRRLEVLDRVVAPAPVQLLLTGGDRFLAANFESIRAAATASDAPEAAASNASFGIRARQVVAQLNPCHEDNYYYGNALLTWGGAVAQGNDLLQRAAACRNWDEFPPFFQGFNQFFFLHDAPNARKFLEVAAQRSKDNAAVFRKLAIMIAVGEFKDDELALRFLDRERAQATDPKLKQMLDKRFARLAGLITLRTAQRNYETRFGRALAHPVELIESRMLDGFPMDPLGIGYEFDEGQFRLKEVTIPGVERPW